MNARIRGHRHTISDVTCLRLVGGATACLALAIGAGSSFAAPPPPVPPNLTPGALQNQFLKTQPPPPTTAPAGPALTAPPPATQPATMPGGPTFLLNDVQFTKSKFLSADQLHKITLPYVGKNVTFGELQTIVAEINKLYLKNGILTGRAVLEPGKISDGVVQIQLVEGVLGEVKIEGKTNTPPNYIFDRLSLKSGEVLDDQSIEKSIDFFNRTNDTQLRAALRPGSQFGLTDILLFAQAPRKLTLTIGVDNYGNPATGRAEGTEYLNVYSPLNLGDRFNLYAVQSDGSIDNNVAYSVPITDFGTSIGASFAYSSTHIISGPNQSLDIKGPAFDAGANITQTIVGTRHWLINTALQYEFNNSSLETSGVELGDTNVNKESFGLTLQGNWDLGSFSLVQTASYAQATSPSSSAIDPFIYTGNFYGTLNFTPQIYGSMLAGWQYTPSDSLPPVELFQLGGENSVRGFDTDVVAGNSGFFSQLELHYHPFKIVDAYSFFDQGYLRSTFPAHTDMQSAGFGARLFLFDRLTINGWVGFPFQNVTPEQDSYEIGASLLIRVF